MDSWTGNSIASGAIPLVRSCCSSNDFVCQVGSTASFGPSDSYNEDTKIRSDASSFLRNVITDPQRRFADESELGQDRASEGMK